MNDQINNINLEDAEQLVVFQLGEEYYGVNIGAVNTIVRMQEITAVPRTPEYIKGVINLRGHIIAILDLRTRFGMPVGEVTKSSRIVVVETGDQQIGVIVDAVAETLKLGKESIEPPSPVISNVDTQYLRGVGKHEDRLVILLDLEKVLSQKEMKQLQAIGEKAAEAQAA